jgi:hypothetical protein
MGWAIVSSGICWRLKLPLLDRAVAIVSDCLEQEAQHPTSDTLPGVDPSGC